MKFKFGWLVVFFCCACINANGENRKSSVPSEIIIGSVSSKVGDEEYESCLQDAGGVILNMIGCIQLEIERYSKLIVSHMKVASVDSDANEVASMLAKNEDAWRIFIGEQCGIYLRFGGQRGELLNKSCILNEVSRREKFVVDVINEAKY
jgi:hypothetical protein